MAAGALRAGGLGQARPDGLTRDVAERIGLQLSCAALLAGITLALLLLLSGGREIVVTGAEPAADPDRPGREIVTARTESSRTFQRADGSLVTHLSTGSLNFRAGDGSWRPIDNRLVPVRDGLRNRAGAYRLSLPGQLRNGEIRVNAGGDWVAFAPLGTTAGAKVSAAGATATYVGAWPGVDLQYTATANTVKEALVVDSAGSMRDFGFTLRAPKGATLARSPGGGFAVHGSHGPGRLALAAPFMIDAAGRHGAVMSALTKVAGGWQLTLRPDRAWLADPARRWPVTVDPQVQVGPSRDCDISDLAGGDCGDQWLEVGWYWDRQLRIFHGLLAFDVASAVPQGNRVVSARLRVRGPAAGYTASRLTAAWDGNVDWQQRNATNAWTTEGGDYDASSGVDGVPVPGSPWTVWDVTATVRQWADGVHPNHGLLIQDPNLPDGGGEDGSTILLDSSRSSNPPYLEIVHEKRDIVHARAYDADPSAGGDELADEYVRLLTRSARRSAEADGYHAQTVTACAADPGGCLESRSFDATQNIHSTVLGTSPNDDRVGVSEVIDAVDDAVGAPLQTGSINAVLASWQTPPPGHGSTFELYETTEDAGVNGVDVTVRERVWLDAETRLPLRQQVLEDTTVVEEQFYSYTSERLAPSEVDADFFRPEPPPGAQTTSYSLDPPEPEPAARASDPEPQRSRSRQLAGAQAFREAHGLSTNRALMESLLDDPPENATIVRFGVPLTDQELAEMETRLAMQRARSIVDDFGAEERATYAGSYLDHRSGGVLRVGFTADARAQLKRLRAAFPYPRRLRSFTAERTLLELHAIQRELQQDAQNLRSTLSVQETSVDESENQVVAGDAAPTLAQGAALRARYGDAVRLVRRDPVLPSSGWPPAIG